jgi:hypothetical protein
MKCYGTDEYGNIYSREADKAPLGENVCNARESFDVPPKCPDGKRLIVENQKWQIIDLDKTLIKESGIIRPKTQIEKYKTGVEEIPKGYKIVDKELTQKTLDEQLKDGDITREDYNNIMLNSRSQSYISESDGLFFDYQRGEIDKQIWLDKVNEIKLRYPKV